MPYQRYTLADLRQLLADREESVPYFDEEDLDRAINEALKLWSALTGYWRQRIVVPGTADTPLLPIPGTIVQRTTLTYQGRLLGPPVALDELSHQQPNWWKERTSDGGSIPTRPVVWTPIGLSLVAVWPAPLAQASYEVDGIRQTPVLTSAGAFVDIGDEEISILLGYAIHAMAIKPGAVFLERTETYRRQFLMAAALRNARLGSQNWFRRYERQAWQKAIKPEAVPPVDTSLAAS